MASLGLHAAEVFGLAEFGFALFRLPSQLLGAGFGVLTGSVGFSANAVGTRVRFLASLFGLLAQLLFAQRGLAAHLRFTKRRLAAHFVDARRQIGDLGFQPRIGGRSRNGLDRQDGRRCRRMRNRRRRNHRGRDIRRRRE